MPPDPSAEIHQSRTHLEQGRRVGCGLHLKEQRRSEIHIHTLTLYTQLQYHGHMLGTCDKQPEGGYSLRSVTHTYFSNRTGNIYLSIQTGKTSLMNTVTTLTHSCTPAKSMATQPGNRPTT